MNEQEAKDLWKGQNVEGQSAPTDIAQIAAMNTRMSGFDRTITGRDYVEIAACVFNVLFFGWNLIFRHHSALTQAGCVVIIVGSVFIGWKLIASKHRLAKAKPDAPVLDAVTAELKKVENQIGLLKSVAWWYLLPLFVGVLMFSWGGSGGVVFKVVYSVSILALFVFIHWLNQRSVRNNLLPLKTELDALLHSVATGEASDETDPDDRRGPALSMAEIHQARPVEFRVAFWQIALYGEIGFIGIWFFGMLALTNFDVPRMFLPQHLIWIVPCFLLGLLYSWVLQKSTERALGISALGIHLGKGLTVLRWDEIQEARPLRIFNIRSLWLIKATGEKRVMPWTSVEGRADLKAAIEKFSPENHPIRNHLSLLKPELSKKDIMKRNILIGIGLLSVVALALVYAEESKSPVIEYTDPTSKFLEEIRQKHDFPALAAAVVVDGKTVLTNAVGFRKNGGSVQVTANDKFHLGSVTKSMTATVAAMLVEERKISWTKTVGDSFPKLKGKIHADYLDVTLEQLLSHRSGAPGNAPGDLWRKAWDAEGTPAEQRLAFVEGLLARQPESTPGTKFVYSNQGYTIAGVMLENATDKTWEDLLQSMLFDPLGMSTAGFGAPASLGKEDQPWGHSTGLFKHTAPVPPGPAADNPLAISPAGAVHCSLGDLAKYTAFHMAGERGDSELLKADSFKRLHTVVGENSDYALGWIVLARPWAGGPALMHNGSNTMFYVVVWMAPEKNCAVIVAANVGINAAFAGCDEVAGNMINQYLGK